MAVDILAVLLIVLALAGAGVGVWSLRTRTRAIGAQRARYEQAVKTDRAAFEQREGEIQGTLVALTRAHADLQNQYGATLAMQQAAREEATTLRQRLGERDIESADLKQKIGQDWKGDLLIAVTRERGKGGVGDVRVEGSSAPARAHREVVPIRGTQTRAQALIEHPSGDLLRVDITVRLGADSGDSI